MIVKDILISDIEHIENIRQKTGSEEEDANFMQNIKDNGLLQPIGVKENKNGKYDIIWGNRRLSTCIKLGWKSIPAVVYRAKEQSMSEEEFLILNATENLQRKPNTLLELGRIVKILKSKGLSNSEIAVRLSLPKVRVENALMELERIPPKWQKKIRLMEGTKDRRGDIPMTTAAKIVRLRGLSQKQRNDLYAHVSKNDADVSARKIEMLGAAIRDGKSMREALSVTEQYKVVNCKIYLHNDKLKKVLQHYESLTDFIVAALNKKMPGIAIKDISHH